MKDSADRFVVSMLIAFVLASFMAGGCQKDPPPAAPIVIIRPDGGEYDEPFDIDGATLYANPKCAIACAHLQDLMCADGFRRPGEDSCYVVCKRAEQTGKIDFHLDCVIGAKTLDVVRACKSYRCQEVVK